MGKYTCVTIFSPQTMPAAYATNMMYEQTNVELLDPTCWLELLVTHSSEKVTATSRCREPIKGKRLHIPPFLIFGSDIFQIPEIFVKT